MTSLHAQLAEAVTEEEERAALEAAVLVSWPLGIATAENVGNRAEARHLLRGPRAGRIGVALLMVPEGFSFRVGSTNIEGEMEHTASVNWMPEEIGWTPALALALAALKARGHHG